MSHNIEVSDTIIKVSDTLHPDFGVCTLILVSDTLILVSDTLIDTLIKVSDTFYLWHLLFAAKVKIQINFLMSGNISYMIFLT